MINKKEQKEEYRSMTQKEWTEKGKSLFGDDFFKWKFKCPICGNIQTADYFRKYKDAGATPDSCRCECIGRYMPKEKVTAAFGDENKKIKRPCDYAAYGLFRIGHKVKLENGNETVSFPFAEP